MEQRPKSIRAIRRLRKKEPKLVEGVKQTLFLRGNKSNDSLLNFLKNMVYLIAFSVPSENSIALCFPGNTIFTHSKAKMNSSISARRWTLPCLCSALTARKDRITSSSAGLMSTKCWTW